MIDFHCLRPTWRNLHTSSASLQLRVRVRSSINRHAEWIKNSSNTFAQWFLILPVFVCVCVCVCVCVSLGVTSLMTEYSQVTFSFTFSQNDHCKLCVLKTRESQHQEKQSVNSAFTMKSWLTDCHLWTLPLTWRRGCGLLSCLAYLCCQWHTSKTQMRK